MNVNKQHEAKQTVKEHAGSAASVSQMIKMFKTAESVFVSFQVSSLSGSSD